MTIVAARKHTSKPTETITLGVNGQLYFWSTLEYTHNFDRRATHIYFIARHDTFLAEVLVRLVTAEAHRKSG